MITIAAVMLAAAIGAGYFAYRAQADLPGVKMADQGNRHIRTAATPHEAYNSDPPTSGPHLPHIAPWGVHTRPIPPELQVHNLEDGGVLVQYNCECPELVAQLRTTVDRYAKHVILAPYPAMKSKIALTAWTRIDTMETFDEKRIVRFIEAYRGQDHHAR
ncbi:MAG: DUF3105 domain-containing protein [Candidatus Rokubacteria bacterium]|nr:DUF3105 domain-containing protein [Candidatus Rokubacteria bacterium]